MDTQTRPTLTDALRKAVRDTGRSAYAVAAASGITQAALSRFLRGKRGITLETADKLCAHLGLELKAVAVTEAPPPPPL